MWMCSSALGICLQQRGQAVGGNGFDEIHFKVLKKQRLPEGSPQVSLFYAFLLRRKAQTGHQPPGTLPSTPLT